MSKAKVSKYMQKLATKYNLDVEAFWDTNIVGDRIKIYKFSGNFLANFEALAKEAKGYVKSSEYGNGCLVKQY